MGEHLPGKRLNDLGFENANFPIHLVKRGGLGLPQLGLGLFLVAASVGAQEGIVPLPALENLVGEWSRLRVAIADEQRSWKDQEDHWRTEISLLQMEAERLREELESAADVEASVETAQLDAQRNLDRLSQSFDGLRALLSPAENALRAWPDRLPSPLRVPLDAAFQRLPKNPEEAALLTNGARLQTVVAFYSEIDKLQQDVHFVKEVLARPDGSRQEMDVCYLGLARAFAVSPDNAWAAVGTPAENGWVWEPHPAIAERVRRAVSVYNRELAAELISLPLRVTESRE
jgi:hypothetical protein